MVELSDIASSSDNDESSSSFSSSDDPVEHDVTRFRRLPRRQAHKTTDDTNEREGVSHSKKHKKKLESMKRGMYLSSNILNLCLDVKKETVKAAQSQAGGGRAGEA